jgi:endonuclease/exonuclease/phosphatase family metal-dependent hydrolase
MLLKVISWNVLHIIHELNYCVGTSPVLDKYKVDEKAENEKNRIKDIFNIICKKLDKDVILCLQEVPGDLYDCLTEMKEYCIYNMKYSREPKIKNTKYTNPYNNKGEYIVTVVHKDNEKLVTGQKIIQFDDPGKAAFIINIDNTLVINSHIPFGKENRVKALKQVYEYLMENSDKTYIFGGDMNMRFDELKGDLKDIKWVSYKVPQIKGQTRKYKQNGDIKYNKIDHFIVSEKINVCSTSVEDNDDLSDHFAIMIIAYN